MAIIPQIQIPEKAAVYQLPKAMVGGLVWSALTLQKRSLAHDARWAIRGLRPPLQVLGGERVPSRRPCLVACNHYSRPGFDAWWVALAISAAIAERRAASADLEMRWVMTAAWTFPESAWKRRYLTPITRWAFARVAQVYGFVPMPPMPPDPNEVEARASAVLRTVRLARQIAPTGGMIGLAPEGRDVATGQNGPADLGQMPAGVGSFIALLVQAGLPVLPVGVGEREERLCVSFGPPFEPEIPVERGQRDRALAEQVMSAISLQLGRIL